MRLRTGTYKGFSAWILAGVLLLAGATGAESQTRLDLTDESRLWIEGSSSVNTFTCVAGEVDGGGLFREVPDSALVEAELRVPVRRFDCGKDRMNKDMYAALKAKDYPEIHFRLEDVDLEEPAAGAGTYSLQVTGQLTIAGTERTFELPVEALQSADGTYRAAGRLPLLMSDFGIDPPTALLGLIKAHNEITVCFDLVATADSDYYSN
jgi:polyisoprenoid-binding protein YceI